jgi:cytidylate kinase
MANIIISRGCYQRGSEVAKKVAAELGYECISREVLLEASKLFDIPELKLTRAIEDAPSLLERFGRDRRKYITYIRTVLLREVQKGNVVYHGFAGHFFLQGIPSVLKVRVFADLEQRVKDEVERSGVSAEKARQMVLKDDEERRNWALSLYGMDPIDPALYDLILHIGSLTVPDAARIVAETAALPSFQMTSESKRLLNDRVLAAQVESLLLEEFPRVEVTAANGEAFVFIHTGLSIHTLLIEKQKIIERVEAIAIDLGGAEKVQVTFEHPI